MQSSLWKKPTKQQTKTNFEAKLQKTTKNYFFILQEICELLTHTKKKQKQNKHNQIHKHKN